MRFLISVFEPFRYGWIELRLALVRIEMKFWKWVIEQTGEDDE